MTQAHQLGQGVAVRQLAADAHRQGREDHQAEHVGEGEPEQACGPLLVGLLRGQKQGRRPDPAARDGQGR